MFYKSIGLSKVLLRYNKEHTTPFQPVAEEEILNRFWFNRFTYESNKNLYDVEVRYDGKIEYYQNMKICEKNRYHKKIEEHFKEDIQKTINKLPVFRGIENDT